MKTELNELIKYTETDIANNIPQASQQQEYVQQLLATVEGILSRGGISASDIGAVKEQFSQTLDSVPGDKNAVLVKQLKYALAEYLV